MECTKAKHKVSLGRSALNCTRLVRVCPTPLPSRSEPLPAAGTGGSEHGRQEKSLRRRLEDRSRRDRSRRKERKDPAQSSSWRAPPLVLLCWPHALFAVTIFPLDVPVVGWGRWHPITAIQSLAQHHATKAARRLTTCCSRSRRRAQSCLQSPSSRRLEPALAIASPRAFLLIRPPPSLSPSFLPLGALGRTTWWPPCPIVRLCVPLWSSCGAKLHL